MEWAQLIQPVGIVVLTGVAVVSLTRQIVVHRTDKLNERFSATDAKIDAVDQKVAAVDQKVGDIKSAVLELRGEVKGRHYTEMEESIRKAVRGDS